MTEEDEERQSALIRAIHDGSIQITVNGKENRSSHY
jgi:hypothetical protein